MLRDLGLDVGLLELETAALSGGQAARASLAAILLSRFDVLLLDEPTNDLDFDGLARLERFVAERPGGAVIVSHDRAFLERTVTRVLELDEIAHTASEYGGGWAGYLELRATAARHHEQRFDSYSAQRERLTDRVHRQRQWSETGVKKAKGSDPDKSLVARRAERSEKQAGKVRASEKALERLDAVEKPWKRWELQLRFGGGERSGDVTARLERAELRRGSFVLGPLDLELAWGERVALVGPNGSGKTTLVDGLLGRLPLSAGARWVGPGVRIGTLDQARAGFDGDGTLIDAFVEQSGMTQQDARSLLAKFGLEQDEVGRGARSLSPGQRTRASLALLMASGANWLVLDEPTNHLDLPAIEQLESALERLRRHAAARHPRPSAARGADDRPHDRAQPRRRAISARECMTSGVSSPSPAARSCARSRAASSTCFSRRRPPAFNARRRSLRCPVSASSSASVIVPASTSGAMMSRMNARSRVPAQRIAT